MNALSKNSLFLVFFFGFFTSCLKDKFEVKSSSKLSTTTVTPTVTSEVTYNVPIGAVVAFNASTCPTVGWTSYSLANGRIIFGSGVGNLDASGASLTSRSIGATGGRTYTTGIPASTSTSNLFASPGPTKNLSASTAIVSYYDGSGSPSLVSLAGTLADSNMPPYSVLTYCKKTTNDSEVDQGAIVPTKSASCSTGYSLLSSLAGRFTVGAGSGNSDADGTSLSSRTFGSTGGIEYTSSIPAYNNVSTLSLPSPTSHLGVSSINSLLRDVPDTTLSGVATDSNLPPFIVLNACERGSAAGAGLQSEAILYFDLSTCPEGWSTYTNGKGRAWIAAGSGNLDALGASLTSRTLLATGGREYTTGLPAIQDIGTSSIPSSSGVFSIGNGSQLIYTTDAANTTLSGVAADSNMPPFISLLQCIKN